LKIYKYSDGKVHELEVRETPKLFISVDDKRSEGPFRWCSRFRKDESHLSPEEAIETRRNQLNSKIERLNGWLDAAILDLLKLERCWDSMCADNNKKPED
jgi:hypothetical protein